MSCDVSDVSVSVIY